MTVISIVKIPLWKKKGISGKGIIKELKDTEEKYKDRKETRVESTTYIYNLEIQYNGQIIMDEYKEVVPGDKDSKTVVGTEFDLYWDENGRKYFNYTEGKKAILVYPIVCVICIAVFILCGIIATAIS